MGRHRKSHEGTLKKTLAAGAIAGAAVGFGALAASPMASADNSGNTGWWLGSGNLNDNNTIFGQMGSGTANQFGNANGNIMNNQLNALSPVIGGTAVQANVITPITTNTETLIPVSAANGNNLGATVGLDANTPIAVPLGAALGGANVTGANANAAIPIAAGAAIPVQIPVQIPILGTTDGTVTQTGVGAQNNGPTLGGVIDDADTAEGGTNEQIAAAIASSRNDNHATNNGGNTRQNSTINGATTNNVINNNNSATAGGNIANNSSNNNTNTGSGTNSPNSVGNSHTGGSGDNDDGND